MKLQYLKMLCIDIRLQFNCSDTLQNPYEARRFQELLDSAPAEYETANFHRKLGNIPLTRKELKQWPALGKVECYRLRDREEYSRKYLVATPQNCSGLQGLRVQHPIFSSPCNSKLSALQTCSTQRLLEGRTDDTFVVLGLQGAYQHMNGEWRMAAWTYGHL